MHFRQKVYYCCTHLYMESNLSDFEEEPPLRPTLLTVLCILSFIGSGWIIVSNIYTYSTAAHTARMFSINKVKISNDSSLKKDSAAKRWRRDQTTFGPKMMTSLSKVMTEDNIRKSAIGNIISALCTLLGALLMWRLRRSGFYLYIAGTIVGLLAPFYLYGNNLLAVGISSVPTFFGLVFIALYALNIKNLR